jgi:hypothetical protein
MSKRILVKEAGLMNFFKSFFKAKADGNESEWLQKLRKADPKLADIWHDYDKSLSNDMKVQKAAMDRLGLDSSHIDDFTKQYGIK